MSLYPLKFHPILKERIWGGHRLVSFMNKPDEIKLMGESWEISGVEGDISMVSNGNLKGTFLTELIESYGDRLLGSSILDQFGKNFPILIKFIDAHSDLSIQVHPDDKLAKERHNSFGKTEMWYILHAEKDAKINIGFKTNLNKEEYLKKLEQNKLTDILHYENIKVGDAYLINAGKIHAIGAGTMLAEIQQTSDVTYRIYDYNRKDQYGNTRELHTKEAIQAICFEHKNDFKKPYDTMRNQPNNIISSPYFITNYLSVNQQTRLSKSNQNSFTILICIGGSATIENEYGTTSIRKGETVLLSASSEYINIISSKASFLEVYL